MPQSTVKRKHLIIHSDAKPSEDEQPAKKKQKWASKPSKKVAETDKENLKKAATKIAKLRKKMKKLKSQNINDKESTVGDNNEDIESKDEEQLGFSSSIQPLKCTDLDNESNNDQQATIPLNIAGGSVAVGGSIGTPANDDQPSSDSEPEASALLLSHLCNGVKLIAAPAVNDYASSTHAFPSLAVQVTWATDAWKEIQDEQNKKIGNMDAL
ncbi:hypothetical protein H0H87_001308 [Tephrocybe sp. NHM501043]|nr:hypothetical protein H0H87_001308 [Tephrocybe sp. NHM501043]